MDSFKLLDYVAVQKFVTYTTDYTAETLEHEKQDFWLGQVTDINSRDSTLSITMFHTLKRRNGDLHSGGAKYAKWRGTNECELPLSRVLDVIESLTAGGLIPKKHVRCTMHAIQLKHEDARREVDTAVAEGSSAPSSSSSTPLMTPRQRRQHARDLRRRRQDAFDYALTLLHAIGDQTVFPNDALDSWMTRFDDLPESYDERMDEIFIQDWVHEHLELLQLGRVERFATRDDYDEYLEASFRRVAHACFRDE